MSIFVLRKQSSASSGRCTIGSFSLNEMVSRTGTPEELPVEQVRLSVHRLEPPAPVRVGDRRDHASLVALRRPRTINGQGATQSSPLTADREQVIDHGVSFLKTSKSSGPVIRP